MALMMMFLLLNSILQVNSLILQSRPLRQEEWSVYNKTSTFIEELPSRLNRNKYSILIGHILLDMIESKTAIKVRQIYTKLT